MKNYSHSPIQFGFLPRLRDLPLSNILPHFIISVLLLTVCFAAIAPAQSADAMFVATNYKVPAEKAETISSLERRVFDLVNNERIKSGRKPLLWIDQAAAVARFHSTNMAEYNYLSHSDLAGKRVADRADQFGLNDWRWIGENIAWLSGYADPATRVVERWMNSPDHRENIMQSTYREAGIGLALSREGKYYFTQVFVFRK